MTSRGGPPRVRTGLGVTMVLGSAVLFAVNGTVSKLILRAGLDAPRLTLLRASGATLGLLALAVAIPPGYRRLRVTRREVPLLVGYGLAGFFLVPMLYFVAISRLPVGIGLLFEYMAPLLVALWIRFGQRRRVRRRLWAGLATSLLGLSCVAQVWRTGAGRLDGLGVAAGLGAALMLAFYYVLGAHGVTRRDALSLTTWAFGVAAVAGTITWLWWDFPVGVLARTWPLVLYLICCGSITAYLLVSAALRHLPPTSVGIIGMAEPVIAATVAWLVLGESLHPAQLVGGVLILVGVALAETARIAGPGEPVPLPGGPPPMGARPPVEASGPPDDVPAGSRGAVRRPIGEDGGMHPNVIAVQDALESADARDGAGAPSRVRMLPDAVHTAPAAAEALSVEVGQIANSLIFDADGEPLLVLTSGAHRVDTAKVAALVGVSRLGRATPEFVREHTGQPIGGVAPLGHPKSLRTLVDTALGVYPEIWAAGGVPRAVFPTTYPELVRITSGAPTEVA